MRGRIMFTFIDTRYGAFYAGHRAHKVGLDLSDNPHADGPEKAAWARGWEWADERWRELVEAQKGAGQQRDP